MNNVLDKNYPEISFKTDTEDLRVMIDYLNQFGEFFTTDNNQLQRKISIILLREIRDKLLIKELSKKVTTKKFLMKFKAYHIAALTEAFSYNNVINGSKPFERNCINMYKDQFHQKLTGL